MALINIKTPFLKNFAFGLIGALCIVTSLPAHAEEMKARYKVYWGGMHVADLDAVTNGHKISTSIDTKGMVGMVSHYKNQAEATLTKQNGEYVPTRFMKKSQKVTGNKHTEISYSAAGAVNKLDSSETTEADTMSQAGDMRAVDPLSAYVIAREKVKAAIRDNSKHFSLSTYDGKKLARLDFEVVGLIQKEIRDQIEHVYHVRMTRVPLKGFNSDETSNSVVELYISNDEHLIPLMADANAPIGHATIILDQRCYPADHCA